MNSKKRSETDYFDCKDNIEDLISTTEAIKAIQCFEKTVDVCGIVNNIEIRDYLLKFSLSNRTNDVIQCLIWNTNLIDNNKKIVIPNHVIHVNAGYARPKNTYSSSTFEYDINIESNTVLRTLKVLPHLDNLPVSLATPLPKMTLKNVAEKKPTGPIELVGYILNTMNKVSLSNNTQVTQGSLSDCNYYKMELRLPIVYDMSAFKRGQHVKIKGVVKYTDNGIYFLINSPTDVSKESDELKHPIFLIKGDNLIDKEQSDEDNGTENKKIKTETDK